MSIMMFFFFFQAEDGIRDVAVTGVQTCALPILTNVAGAYSNAQPVWRHVSKAPAELTLWLAQTTASGMGNGRGAGREKGRTRWAPYHLKKKKKETIK